MMPKQPALDTILTPELIRLMPPGNYSGGLLRFLQAAGVEVLDLTAPDKLDRFRRGKNNDHDAERAAHSTLAKRHTVIPRSRDRIVESLRVLMVYRKTAVQARRITV